MSLEGELKRKEETCNIQEERIKALENPAVANLFDKYLHRHSDPPPSSANDVNHQLLQQLVSDFQQLKNQMSSLEARIVPCPHTNVTVTSDPNEGPKDTPEATIVEDEASIDPSTQNPPNLQPPPSNETPRTGPPPRTFIQSKHAERRKKGRVIISELKKPLVKIQPWLNSAVWDNAPTLPLKYSRKVVASDSPAPRTVHQRRNRVSSTRGPVQQTLQNGPARTPTSEQTPSECVRLSWNSRFPSHDQSSRQNDLN